MVPIKVRRWELLGGLILLMGLGSSSLGAGLEINDKTPVVQAALSTASNAPAEILKALEERKRALDQREEALRKEEQRLSVIRNDVENSLKKILALRDEMKKLSAAGKKPESKMDQLVKVYETMSPEEAAARMNIMDEKLAIELLSGMKGKTVGKILGNMTPEKAAALSSKLAKR